MVDAAPLPSWMRTALYATAVMNVVAGCIFFPGAAPLRALAGLPEAGHPVYPATVGVFVVLFGVGYGLAARAGHAERLFIGIAAAGKLSFFFLLVAFWAAGSLPARVPMLGAADLLFGSLFLVWLFGAERSNP